MTEHYSEKQGFTALTQPAGQPVTTALPLQRADKETTGRSMPLQITPPERASMTQSKPDCSWKAPWMQALQYDKIESLRSWSYLLQ